MFGHSRSYKFVIDLYSPPENESDSNLITSLLKLSPIKICPSVKIRVVPLFKPAMIQPEAISDFFQSGGDQLFEIVKAEKFLKIECDIYNFSEIIDHLKQVHCKILTFLLNLYCKNYEILLKMKKQDPKDLSY